MKLLFIALTCLSVGSLSAIAGSCGGGGCGDKGKKGEAEGDSAAFISLSE